MSQHNAIPGRAEPPAITPRPQSIAEAAAIVFDVAKEARALLRTCSSAALATLDPQSGFPFATVTNVATLSEGTPIFLLIGLAIHARNVRADDRISMVFADIGPTDDALIQPRLSLVGRALQIDAETVPEAQRRYMARHPKAQVYLKLRDAVFFKLDIEAVQYNGGPRRNAGTLTANDLIVDRIAASLSEEAELSTLNADDKSLAKLAEAMGGKPGRWRAAALDAEGLDLVSTTSVLRLAFEQPATTIEDLRTSLRNLLAHAS